MPYNTTQQYISGLYITPFIVSYPLKSKLTNTDKSLHKICFVREQALQPNAPKYDYIIIRYDIEN